jgi:penicillin-binding protein 1A
MTSDTISAGIDPSRVEPPRPSPQTALDEPGESPEALHERLRAFFVPRRLARRFVAKPGSKRWRYALLIAASLVPLCLLLSPVAWLVHHVYFDRSDVPNLDAFVRFEIPSTGVVRDRNGKVLIEVAREYRKVVTYDQVPVIMRQAILAAEDKRFFSHSGVDYSALPRVIRKAASRSWSEWRNGGDGLRLLLPQGGSTLTQQLVRGYFLRDMTSRPDSDPVFHEGFAPSRLCAEVLGASATNKLSRKLEEVRLTLWLEREMVRRHGSREQAKREIFVRYANFLYLGNGRYGYATASEYYFGRPLSTFTPDDADKAALLAAIGKSPHEYAPEPGNKRLLARRNQILGLMARNGYISTETARLGQVEPIRVAELSPFKTDAPAVINHVFSELKTHGGSLFGVEDLFQGRISVLTTVDERLQRIVNDALEQGLARYEKRHPGATGVIQGSVVVLRNADAAILAEAGGRQVYADRRTLYSDYNRVTDSLRQPGSAMKPLVYLAAFEKGLRLDTEVLDQPIGVPLGRDDGIKWISNYDNQFKGPISCRQALAESRNTVAVWLTQEIGVRAVIRTAGEMGIHTPLQPYLSTALGASEVQLLELANAYRSIASGLAAKPYVISRVTGVSGTGLYEARRDAQPIRSVALRSIQEGLRGVVRIPGGTAHSLASRDFPIEVMGKTGTTSDYRDALFVGSTWGPEGLTVAVRIGFDDNRPLGTRETGGRAALPVFREIMLRAYTEELLGQAPRFPLEIETAIDEYLVAQAELMERRRLEALAAAEELEWISFRETAIRSLQ